MWCAVRAGLNCCIVSRSASSSATKIWMTLQSSATSAIDPTKFGTGRGVRFQTNTRNPRLRRFSATRRPIMPRPINPTFLRLRRDMLCSFRKTTFAECARESQFKQTHTQCRTSLKNILHAVVHFFDEISDRVLATHISQKACNFPSRFLKCHLMCGFYFRQPEDVKTEM